MSTGTDCGGRDPSRLTSTQRAHLDRWGYPYVMAEFRFHMTLTGRLGSERREPTLAMLKKRFSELELATLAVDRIAVFRQENAASRFRIVSQWELRAAQPRAFDQGLASRCRDVCRKS
jgi:2'-5' RNA ligase